MPYREVAFRAGEYYHVYNRGNNRERVFFTRENYLFFLRRWRHHLSSTAQVICYCLMPNHYHFLIQLKADEFSDAMQVFTLSYTKALNKRYGRVGSLFQGRFRAIHVDMDAYLLHLSRYIHLNPVIAHLVTRPEDWEFSSYREFINLRQGTLPLPGIILSQIGSEEQYRQFTESLAPGPDISHLLLD